MYDIPMMKKIESKKERIIEACAKAISTSGFKKASVLDVAKEAGVAKGLIYYYFDNRNKLIFETYLYYVEKLKSYIDSKMRKSVDLFELLESTIRAKVTFFKDYPEARKFLELSMTGDNKLISEFNRKSTLDSNNLIYENIDRTRFKRESDIQIVLQMVSLIGQSIFSKVNSNTDIDKIMKDCHAYLKIIKMSVYKENEI